MLPTAADNQRSLTDEAGSGEGFLYRYRDLVGDRAERVKQIMVDSKLYFASSADFNDPFDCKARFRGDLSPEDFSRKANALMVERGIPRAVRRRNLRAQKSIPVFASNVSRGLQQVIDQTGILSLSSTHENILMWAHYAFGHRGVCLQFRVTTNPPFLGTALPVQYSKKMETPDLFGVDHNDRVKAILLTKAEDWKYEREWRVIQPDSAPGIRDFPPALLSGLILGANISENNREKTLAWVEQRPGAIDVYQAERHPERFALTFRLLEGL